ncbi:hypothetical protein SteCoe_4652 [Stentor coeruleus]|uniref:Uncharacterized protein n=1 Tax=Stentor coeruleus TaxID=5963 RepID=A0A1R2CU84_9CILI|nr:hypothetical protein SteCoe_4652 [Stentor coeruleus]
MDPNYSYFLNFSHTNPLFFQNNYYPSYQTLPAFLNSNIIEEKPAKLEKNKYQRTWNKVQVEEVFNLAIQYCQKNNKVLEEMTLNDFGLIAIGLSQTPEQVMLKVKEVMVNGTLRPGKWSQSEDEMLGNLVNRFGCKWGKIASFLNEEVHNRLNIRNSKTCKERWNNYLNPNINRGPWTEGEDSTLLEGFLKHGNKWSIIAKLVPGRIEGLVKNRIKSLVHKIKQESGQSENVFDKIKGQIETYKISLQQKYTGSNKSYKENFGQDI